ncbi:MAG: gfo/Idh/MocA family oxidoreductase, partial [Bryobacteraceae bacterium]
MNRRELLKAGAAAAAPMIVPAGVLGRGGRAGANDRIQIGFIGLGGRARYLISKEEFPGADIVAVADCFSSQ